MPEEKLKLLALWLTESCSDIDPFIDGQLETAIKTAKMETKQEIGNLILEILDMPYKEVLEQVKDEDSCECQSGKAVKKHKSNCAWMNKVHGETQKTPDDCLFNEILSLKIEETKNKKDET